MISKDTWINNSTTSHKDFLTAKDLYEKCNFNCTHLKAEKESTEYGACTFRINEKNITYRIAKITPTKIGQFVTLWKRNKNGVIEPLDLSDNLDFVIISTRDDSHFGQFIFPKLVLGHKRIFSDKDKAGKRAIRVYPPWDKTTNKQAQKTQEWQLDYFLKISEESLADIITKAKRLLL